MRLARRCLRSCKVIIGLSGSERRVLIAAMALLPAVDLSLRVLGLVKTRSILHGLSRRRSVNPRRPADPADARSDRVVRMVRVAAERSPYRVTCLRQSLVIWWLLRRGGIQNDLRIGVRRTPLGLEAHAWVESGGRPINDPDEVCSTYRVFQELFEAQSPRLDPPCDLSLDRPDAPDLIAGA